MLQKKLHNLFDKFWLLGLLLAVLFSGIHLSYAALTPLGSHEAIVRLTVKNDEFPLLTTPQTSVPVKSSPLDGNLPDNYSFWLLQKGYPQSYFLTAFRNDFSTHHFSASLSLHGKDDVWLFAQGDSAFTVSPFTELHPDTVLQAGVNFFGSFQSYLLQDTLVDSLSQGSSLFLSLYDKAEVLLFTQGDSGFTETSFLDVFHPDSILFAGIDIFGSFQSYLLTDTLLDSLSHSSLLSLAVVAEPYFYGDLDSIFTGSSFSGFFNPDSVFLNDLDALGLFQSYIFRDTLVDSLVQGSSLFLSLHDKAEILLFAQGDSALTEVSFSGVLHPDSILLAGIDIFGSFQSYLLNDTLLDSLSHSSLLSLAVVAEPRFYGNLDSIFTGSSFSDIFNPDSIFFENSDALGFFQSYFLTNTLLDSLSHSSLLSLAVVAESRFYGNLDSIFTGSSFSGFFHPDSIFLNDLDALGLFQSYLFQDTLADSLVQGSSLFLSLHDKAEILL
ncbi:MAG: hypothetical protein ACRC9X_04730, partial [Bacteroidales bacterium]